MKLNMLRLVPVLALAIPMAMTGAAQAETAAEFYKGKTITAIAPGSPESTFTVLAQLMAPYLEKITGASIEILPITAGGGYQARNKVYESEGDGLTVTLVGHGPKMMVGSMFNLEGARYDWSEFVPLGKIFESGFVVYVGANSDWRSPADMRGVEFNFGESSPFFGPQVAEALGWDKMRVIPGFKSGPDRATAVGRNEIQATSGNIEMLESQPDLIKLIAVSSKIEGHENVPTISEAATEDGKRWAQIIEAWNNVMYMAYASPGTPQDRVDFLESALQQVWADPAFNADLEKLGLVRSEEFVTSDMLQGHFDVLSALSQEQVDELHHVIYEKYAAH